jgi:putative hydrolase of the HAD superfamily
MGRFRAVIFDLDDTLYPERQFVRGGFAAAARWVAGQANCSADGCACNLQRLFDRGVRGHTFDIWLAEMGLPPALSAGMVQAYREHRPELALHDDVASAIAHCAQAHLVTGLVSDGYLDVQRRKVASLGLAEMLTTIVLSDEFGRAFWKPATKPYLAAVERLGVVPRDVVYVGDNPRKDFEGARRSGLRSVRIRRSDGLYASDEAASGDAEPDREIQSLCHLREVLAAL